MYVALFCWLLYVFRVSSLYLALALGVQSGTFILIQAFVVRGSYFYGDAMSGVCDTFCMAFLIYVFGARSRVSTFVFYGGMYVWYYSWVSGVRSTYET